MRAFVPASVSSHNTRSKFDRVCVPSPHFGPGPLSLPPKSLARAMIKIFKCSLIATAVLALCQQFVLLSVPLIVQQLLGWLIDEDDDRRYVGVIWAIAL